MSNTSNNVAGVDNTFRRKFDREEYLERARERERQEEEGRSKPKAKGPPVQRKPLKHRDYEVDLESRLGKTQVVTPVAPLSQQHCEKSMALSIPTNDLHSFFFDPSPMRMPFGAQFAYDSHVQLNKTTGHEIGWKRYRAENEHLSCLWLREIFILVVWLLVVYMSAGYYCSVCECVVKDSANYLDHINGKKHQRALGMSMRVERASLKQVQERFEVLKKRKDVGSFTEQGKTLVWRRKEKAVEEPEIDPDVAAMMGFGGFRSSKK
ncbi:hypothetical protein ACSQ67_002060 [Phaseolus vulgaris]